MTGWWRVGVGGLSRSCGVPIEPRGHFLAGFEEGHTFLFDGYIGPGARIAAGSSGTVSHGKSAEAAQLNAISARHRPNDLVENGVHNVIHVARIEMRV